MCSTISSSSSRCNVSNCESKKTFLLFLILASELQHIVVSVERLTHTSSFLQQRLLSEIITTLWLYAGSAAVMTLSTLPGGIGKKPRAGGIQWPGAGGIQWPRAGGIQWPRPRGIQWPRAGGIQWPRAGGVQRSPCMFVCFHQSALQTAQGPRRAQNT